MIEQRLFRLAPEAIVSTAVFDPGDGWRVTVTMRRQDEDWDTAATRRFDHLTTTELVAVLSDTAEYLLLAT